VQSITCEKCEGSVPLGETLKVRGSAVCKACAESIFAAEKIPAKQVERQIDPTVCVGCGLDNGNAELTKLGQFPVCPACETLFKNRPFPGWVKAALVGMVVLVVSMMAWNWRFVRAYYELRCSMAAMNVGDLERGATHFMSVAKLVPENTDIQTYGRFYEGMLLLNQNKSAEALKRLQSCKGRVADEPFLDDLIMSAQVGVAFDQGDYDEFLALALQMDARHKDDPAYVGQLASAYACKYAETSDEQYKVKSLAALDRARTLASSKPEYEEYYAEYEPRILHRLYTRQIISRNEFNKRYPNGWTQKDEETP
jgi:hypothetical protein